MIKKAFAVIKNNPVLVVMYLVFTVITELGSILSAQELIASYLFKRGISIIILLLSLIFLSGAGTMLSLAVKTGKTSFDIFSAGVEKYFWRIGKSIMLCAAFLLIMFLIMIIIGVTFLSSLSNLVKLSSSNLPSLEILIFVGIAIFIIAIFSVFLMLWIPAIIMDDSKIIKALVSGFKAAKKNFWKLLLLTIISILPTAVNFMYLFASAKLSELVDTNTNFLLSPKYYLLIIADFVISIVVIPMLFIIYNEYKLKHTPQVVQPEIGGELTP